MCDIALRVIVVIDDVSVVGDVHVFGQMYLISP